MSDLLPGQKIQRLVTEAVRDAFDKGRESERKRIIAQLTQYVTDLKECGKKDNCLDIALAVEGQIEDIKGNQK